MNDPHLIAGLLLLIQLAATGCGNHPVDLKSARDIRRTPKDAERIRIGLLPIGDYPLLSKFERVKDVDFFTMDGTGAHDEKLEAFSKLKLDRLEQICLLNCPAVSDVGIRHLTNFGSLRGLSLEGTAITDDACELLTSTMRLDGVNVANCSRISLKGLLSLARCESFNDLGFSANGLTQADVERLIKEMKTITWCQIIDLQQVLDKARLKSLGQERGITIVVKNTSALEDLGIRTSP